ncbi:MAG: restriction endonuclease subunit S [Ignavibacteria bacterium]
MTTFHKLKFKKLLEPKISVSLKKGFVYSFIPMENVETGKKKPRRLEFKTFNGGGSKFADDDILFARITPCLQNKKIVKVGNLKGGVGFGSTEFFIFRAKKGYTNPDFLYYTLKLDDLINTAILSMVGASGRQRANIKSIYEYYVYAPDLLNQKWIASILSAYDDLIENNEKRIKILEEMAESLYIEWFVKFKFPGHEKVKMVNSGTKYDMIPVGWEVRTVENSFEILGGGTPSRTVSEYWGGKINWYTPSDLTGTNQMFSDSSLEQITEVGLKKSSANLFPPYCIMMTSRATIGAISINTCYSTTNQGFIVCVPNEKIKLYYLYYWLKHNVPLFIELGSGATFKEINKGNFKKINILIPHIDLINQFEKKLKVIGDLILSFQRENRTLSLTRNLLIPQLVTGRRELKIKS